MRASEIIVLAYLIYLLIAAWALRLPAGRRRTVTAVVAADAVAMWWLAGQAGVAWTVVRDCQPVVQILIGYWLSGLFFQAPMPRMEAWLSSGDRWLFGRMGLSAAIARSPRLGLEILELAYLSVYLVLPIGFAIAWMIDPGLDADRYWRAVILAELTCYGVLPWVQTRPPRALNDGMAIANRRLTVRRLNDAILRHGSIQVNTFPSGHAAGAFATALAVAHVSPAAGWVFGIVAVAIVAGSVVGRYHFAADSVAGLIVAVGAWIIFW
jgi:membrane-associated phospholipid phosphatase